MTQEDFAYEPISELYIGRKDNIEVNVYRPDMTDETVETAGELVNAYAEHRENIAEYLRGHEAFRSVYGQRDSAEIIEALGEPMLHLYADGNKLTFFNHSLDDTHVLEIMFQGKYETFLSVAVEG